MTNTPLSNLATRLRQFAADRDWEQFHSPKNLSMALIAEGAELVEIFQWVTEEDSFNLGDDKKQEVEQEVGDILIYLVRFCDQLGIDLMAAAESKLTLNEQKYPARKVRGSPKKYTDYND